MASWDFVSRQSKRQATRRHRLLVATSLQLSTDSWLAFKKIQKQILLGEASTGKSSLLVRLTDDRFLTNSEPSELQGFPWHLEARATSESIVQFPDLSSFFTAVSQLSASSSALVW